MIASQMEIQFWHIDRLTFYARNPRKNDAAVDRMCASIREFGFKIPVLARSNGEVVDGHLRLKAARKLGSWPGGDTDLTGDFCTSRIERLEHRKEPERCPRSGMRQSRL